MRKKRFAAAVLCMFMIAIMLFSVCLPAYAAQIPAYEDADAVLPVNLYTKYSTSNARIAVICYYEETVEHQNIHISFTMDDPYQEYVLELNQYNDFDTAANTAKGMGYLPAGHLYDIYGTCSNSRPTKPYQVFSYQSQVSAEADQYYYLYVLAGSPEWIEQNKAKLGLVAEDGATVRPESELTEVYDAQGNYLGKMPTSEVDTSSEASIQEQYENYLDGSEASSLQSEDVQEPVSKFESKSEEKNPAVWLFAAGAFLCVTGFLWWKGRRR